MKYSIVKIVNNVFSIDSEWDNNLTSAIVRFHSVCADLWNAAEVETAAVEIIDSQGDIVQSYKEFITHKDEPV